MHLFPPHHEKSSSWVQPKPEGFPKAGVELLLLTVGDLIYILLPCVLMFSAHVNESRVPCHHPNSQSFIACNPSPPPSLLFPPSIGIEFIGGTPLHAMMMGPGDYLLYITKIEKKRSQALFSVWPSPGCFYISNYFACFL